MKINTGSAAWWDGYRAYEKSISIDANPYHLDTQEYFDWRWGWYDNKRDYLEAKAQYYG